MEFMTSTETGDAIFKVVVKNQKQIPHPAKGMSSTFKCIGRQVLDYFFPHPFDAHGAVFPGTVGHEFFQHNIPAGTFISSRNNLWEVRGHETLVHFKDGTNRGRTSPIDTLAFNHRTQEYEMWDLKFTRIRLKYLNSPPMDYVGQLNLYGYLLQRAWNLPYAPICRLLYTAKGDYSEKKDFVWRTDPKMGEKSMRNMTFMAKIEKQGFWNKGKPLWDWWHVLAEGLHVWNDYKTPYRYFCKGCHNKDLCMQMLGADHLVGKGSCGRNKGWEYDRDAFNTLKSYTRR